MNPNDSATHPAEIDLDRASELRIRWADGHLSTYPLVELRRACPCATCRSIRDERKRNPLVVVPARENVEEMATVRDAALVGNYALQITWRDGHNTGIYDFARLREMCPCEACSKPRP